MSARKEPAELSDSQVRELMAKAQKCVDDTFSAKEHLPEKVYKFLSPIVVTTCQGFYAVTMMLAGAMAALTNGASVQLWSQKASPLVAMVFQIADAQKGKSRLWSVIEELFDTCDDVVQELATNALRDALEAQRGAASDRPEHDLTQPEPHETTVTNTSISLDALRSIRTWNTNKTGRR